jgi:outer membrane receptor protein involved in Fe transport
MTNFLGEAHSSTTARARALKGVALSAVALAMVAPGFAQAQDVQEVTITGSRIKAPNLTSDSPVVGVSSEEVKQQGTTNVENLLNNLPSVTADAGNVGYGQGGTANVNLRDLGPTRTLVLIDGQRVGPSSASNPATDLNFIPAAMIKSVEVLTGGASSVYGSDAIAGVINFHLLNNFEGVMWDTTFSGYQHNNNNTNAQGYLNNGVFGFPGAPNAAGPIAYDKGAQWDGFIKDNTGVLGVNAADGKGNITMWAEYRATTPVQGPQRDTSACALSRTSGLETCGGSGTGPYGKFTPNASVLAGLGLSSKTRYMANPNGTDTFVKYTGQGYYNFAGTSYEQSQDDRTSLGATGHYKVTDWAEFYTNVMFLHDENLNQLGPSPIAGQPAAGFTQTQIKCSALGTIASPDPALKGYTQQQLMGCVDASGKDLTGGTGLVTTTVPALREQLPRDNQIDTYRYRAVAGLRGDITPEWSYDTTFNIFKTQQTSTYVNYPSLSKLQSAFADGALQWNQYDPALQEQQETDLETIGIMSAQTTDYDIVGSVSGDLTGYGVKTPWARDGVAVVFGVEYRRSEVNQRPDSSYASGDLISSTPVLAFTGAEASREYFSEVRAPLIEDLPWIKALDLNLAFRHSDTDVENSGGGFSSNTYKIAADYAPDEQVRFRGGYNRAVRAPSVYELGYPAVVGNSLGGGSDPCTNGSASLATCTNPNLPAGARVTAAQYGNYSDCTAQQCNLEIGGSSALKPERAETWTWGANLTPDFIPGLAASVDYWDIKVDNYISSISASSILSGCYTNDAIYCQFIHRDALTGSLDSASSSGYINDTTRNLDSLHVNGIDFDMNYSRNLDQFGLANAGAFSLSMLGTYQMMNVTQILDQIKSFDCNGLYGTNCGIPSPRWRHTFRATWNAPWGQDFSFNWRYIGAVKLDANSPSQPNYNGGGANYDNYDARIGSYSYFDLSTSYALWNKYTLRVGVNNVFDKDPPMLALGGALAGVNGATIDAFSTYDTLGRQIYMNFNAKF